jgi:hypothetical protein
MSQSKTVSNRSGLKLSEFMLREDERQALKAVADREHTSMAAILRLLIDQHFGLNQSLNIRP